MVKQRKFQENLLHCHFIHQEPWMKSLSIHHPQLWHEHLRY